MVFCLLLELVVVQSLAKGDLGVSKVNVRGGKHTAGQSVPPSLPRKPGKPFRVLPQEGRDLGDFRWIPAGTFTMGAAPDDLNAQPNEIPAHTVVLTGGFWMCDHEVTQAEYQTVVGSSPSEFQGMDRPVENVSWYDAVAYCQKLTEREVKAGRISRRYAYRLPTEAEREYACRAGTTGPRYGELDAIAWWSGNSGGQTHPVKRKQPNAWGLYDMLGNVDEWCADWFGGYPTESVIDPTGPIAGSKRVLRGGSWFFEELVLRASSRGVTDPELAFTDTGFRVVLSEVH